MLTSLDHKDASVDGLHDFAGVLLLLVSECVLCRLVLLLLGGLLIVTVFLGTDGLLGDVPVDALVHVLLQPGLGGMAGGMDDSAQQGGVLVHGVVAVRFQVHF